MTIKKLSKATARIVSVFIVAMILSFIGEYAHAFLGDWHCKGCNYSESGYSNMHEPQWHWGYRHWLFFIMGIFLFILQAVDIIMYLDNSED